LSKLGLLFSTNDNKKKKAEIAKPASKDLADIRIQLIHHLATKECLADIVNN